MLRAGAARAAGQRAGLALVPLPLLRCVCVGAPSPRACSASLRLPFALQVCMLAGVAKHRKNTSEMPRAARASVRFPKTCCSV
jgi:hypothetical protein